MLRRSLSSKLTLLLTTHSGIYCPPPHVRVSIHLLIMTDPNIETLFYQIFSYNSDLNLLICKNHRSGVQNRNFSTHIKSHTDLTPKTRASLTAFGIAFYSDSVVYPSAPIPALQFLPILENCYKCISINESTNQACGAIYQALSRIQNHC